MPKRFDDGQFDPKPRRSFWHPLQLAEKVGPQLGQVAGQLGQVAGQVAGQLGQVAGQVAGQVFNHQEKPKSHLPTDYGTTKLESKNRKIKELEGKLEEEKKKAEKIKKHKIADQKLKDAQLELDKAKNKNRSGKDRKFGIFGL